MLVYQNCVRGQHLRVIISPYGENVCRLSRTQKGKKDLSDAKAYRQISIGSLENWVLERIFLERLDPYLNVHDCQMGYKKNHSTSHAIEIVRNIERTMDAHVCLLDASAAFDNLSWSRIRDQLIKRKLPPTLIKLVLTQICSNRIRVCGEAEFYPRAGVKQGGILSGKLFATCYDDLISLLYKTGVGVLLSVFYYVLLFTPTTFYY